MLTIQFIMDNVNVNLDNIFGGANLLAQSKESSMRSMKSGMATIDAISVHTKGDSHSLKISFNALAKGQDGHDEYLRTSTAERYRKSLGKAIYLFAHANNDEVKALIQTLPNPISFVKDDTGNNIAFQSNDELEGIRAQYGEDVDFIWASEDKGDKTRIAVRFADKAAFVQKLSEVFSKLIGQSYKLQITPPNGEERFQRLSAITAVPKV